MKLDLLIKEIEDPITRENMTRLKRDLEAQQILNGFFTFFEIEIPKAGEEISIKHNLNFVPRDILITSIEGNQNFNFIPHKFTPTHLIATARGACRVRFLAGNYNDKAYGGSKKDFTYVPPSSLLSGVGIPTASLGSVGDFYLDTATKIMYVKTDTATWT